MLLYCLYILFFLINEKLWIKISKNPRLLDRKLTVHTLHSLGIKTCIWYIIICTATNVFHCNISFPFLIFPESTNTQERIRSIWTKNWWDSWAKKGQAAVSDSTKRWRQVTQLSEAKVFCDEREQSETSEPFDRCQFSTKKSKVCIVRLSDLK